MAAIIQTQGLNFAQQNLVSEYVRAATYGDETAVREIVTQDIVTTFSKKGSNCEPNTDFHEQFLLARIFDTANKTLKVESTSLAFQDNGTVISTIVVIQNNERRIQTISEMRFQFTEDDRKITSITTQEEKVAL